MRCRFWTPLDTGVKFLNRLSAVVERGKPTFPPIPNIDKPITSPDHHPASSSPISRSRLRCSFRDFMRFRCDFGVLHLDRYRLGGLDAGTVGWRGFFRETGGCSLQWCSCGCCSSG
ncbi:Protein of unknown function [Pyronema omphalodes CBS 100304]|uniref:Uncharacterized protein n=1 Tax=Pyronema omphalodes (strain CBS 100304) TaxID=1076935 RepID=U4KU35_PYROM|nr:Protein of unknown function [Pyronema omphalodes CBS 100304]